MRRILLVIALVGILGGCSWFSENVPSAKAETAAQHLLAIEVEYNGVFALMAEYENLKRCRVTSSKVCSDQAVVDRMRLVNTAFDTTTSAAWKIVKQVNAADSVKEAAVNSALAVLADARGLYDSVTAVITGSK